jgi:HK97 family phage portal protein
MGIKGFISGLFGVKSAASAEQSYDGRGAAQLLVQPYTFAGRFGWVDLRQSISWQYYKEISVIRDAVDLGATNFTSVPFAMRDKESDEIYREFDSSVDATNIIKLLENPNEDITETEFKRSHYTSEKVTGETYFVTTVSASEEPLEIFYLNPRNITTTTGTDDIVRSFQVNRGIMKGIYLRVEEDDRVIYYNEDRSAYLWQMKTFNPDAGDSMGRGFSPLSSVYYEIEQFGGVSKHNNAMLRNGVRPSGAIIPNAPNDGVGANLTDEQIQTLKNSVQSFYGGYNNSGNVMVLDGIKEFKELSVSNKDMEFMNLIQLITEQIYRSLGIPLPLVNSKTMTLRNYEEAKFMLFDTNIIPFAIAYAEELTRFLMPFYDDAGRYEIVVDFDRIPAMEERKMRKYEMFRDSMTDNEIRDFVGLEAIEGGDLLRQQQVIAEIDKNDKEDFILAMRDTGRFTAEEIQEKANKIYGHH